MQSESATSTPRIGIFGVGLAAYWPQFPGLQESIAKHLQYIETQIAAWADVVSGGVVDTAQAGAALGDRFARDDLDLVMVFTGTYATSTQTLPVVQRAGAPVLILNLQPIAGMDYETADTAECLANAGVCSVPELAGVFQRAGIAFTVITGMVYDDARVWAEINTWCVAARAAKSVTRGRFGMLGHTYPGMIDMSTDVGAIHAGLEAHVEMLEMNDLKDRAEAATEAEIGEVIARSDAIFATAGDISPKSWQIGARVAVGLESVTRDFDLTGLAYYYRGSPDSEIEQIASNMILGNTLLTARGVPAAGEGDLKTAIAMKLMHELGAGGTFCEFASMDFRENSFLFGHDGPAHIALSDGKPAIRELKVFHGKAGGGLSVEMRAQLGPVTVLGLTQTVHGKLKLIAAEGENLAGPVPRIGNSMNRIRFGRDIPEFLDAWCTSGPTHHVAMGLGHRLNDIRKVATLLEIPLDIVS